MESLIHCIYASAATGDFAWEDLEVLLRQSRDNNRRHDITGMLLYCAGSFFQVLEGPATTVDTLYARILLDTRHEKTTMIIHEPIAKRAFGDWTMGFSMIAPQELATIDGLNDFFGGADCFNRLDNGRTKKLLAVFAQGRWRKRVVNTTLVGTRHE